MSTTDPRELLDALLDGELDADEERDVRTWLETDADGRAELDELSRVRSMLRDLPAVEPPVGFFERMLVDGSIEPLTDAEASDTVTATIPDEPAPAVVTPLAPRRSKRRRAYAGFAGLGAAAAAALILVLGITPVTDKIVPPVNAFAERHDEMASGAPTDPAAPAATTTTVTTLATTSTSTAPPSATTDFRSVAPDGLDAMEAPYVAPARLDGYDRRAAYISPGVVHVMYTHGGEWLSVYEQPGAVDFGHLPANGQMMTVQDDQAWETTIGDQAVLVIDHDGMVVTVVSAAPADDMMRAATSVPEPAELPMPTRMQRGAANVVRTFGIG